MSNRFILMFFAGFLPLCCMSQSQVFTQKDTLRGSLRAERTSFDVRYYDLDIEFDLKNKSIKGSNTISFTCIQATNSIQLDLFENLSIDSIVMKQRLLNYHRLHDAVFIETDSLKKGSDYEIRVYYHGSPIIAKTPPWDGGFIWSHDNFGNPWVAVACEGLGASSWWPNKDHLSDEPDSMQMSFTIPQDLVCISNGNLDAVESNNNQTKTFHWSVGYPINNYNVTFNIGNFAHFSDDYISLDGDTLDMDYYVLPENLEIAKVHFKQTHDVLKAFEFYFGKYPYWTDGYALVETPYLGMEHQSAIAYGNQYMRGYLGGMIPPEMDFDYIIVHETAHEYFGNAVSCMDFAELWIHESFGTYAEALFVEYFQGQQAAERYLSFQKRHLNREPIIGPLGVNYDNWVGSDHYFKGAWVLHTLRNVINDDEKWFALLKDFVRKFSHQNISSAEVFNFINAFTGENYNHFFEQYLYESSIPTLRYRLLQKEQNLIVELIWDSDVEGFHMPIKVGDPNEWSFKQVSSENWTRLELKNFDASNFEIAEDLFLVRYIEE